jgi:excisionase family DNA binding protein
MRIDCELLTIEQVSELLQVSPKTVRNWVYRRKIPHRKINGVLRFLKHEITHWIEAAS